MAGAAAGRGKGERRRIQSISVGFSVICALEEADGPRPLKEIAASARMTASKAYLYLVTFEREGFVRQDPVTGYYGLGPTAIRLGLAAMRQTNIVDLARGELERLREMTQCASYLSIWGNRGPVIASKVDGDWQGSMAVRIGYVLPMLRSSTGRIFHAFLPADETHHIVAAERANPTGLRPLPAQLPRDPEELVEEVRRVGFATSENQINIGFASVAVPVFDHSKRLVAALTVLGPAAILSKRARRHVADLLRDASARLCAQLGGTADTMARTTDGPKAKGLNSPKPRQSATRRGATVQ